VYRPKCHSSSRYEPSSQPLLLAAGEVLTLTIQLAFRQSLPPPVKVRRRYLLG
jgi:hypothetical protein